MKMKGIQMIVLSMCLLALPAWCSEPLMSGSFRSTSTVLGSNGMPMGAQPMEAPTYGSTSTRNAHALMHTGLMQDDLSSHIVRSGSAYASVAALDGPLMSSSRPRRTESDPFDGQTIDDTPKPQQPGAPVGDVPLLAVVLMVAVYVVLRRRRAERA